MNIVPIKILLVEDDPGDADLLREHLREAGAQIQITHVTRLAEALAYLDNM